MINKKTAIDKLIAIAEKEVGVRETTGYNNIGPRIQQYQEATWLKPGAWPWCAAFTCWVLREWVLLPEVLETLSLTPKTARSWLCKDASAFGWQKWANLHGLTVLPETAIAKKGDFVIFDFSHIGIVIADQKSVKSNIMTIEGNTNGKGDRDSESGDGVWKKSRPASLTKCYIRIA